MIMKVIISRTRLLYEKHEFPPIPIFSWYIIWKNVLFQVFLIMINIVLFSSDGLNLERPETASAAQTYFLLFLHRWIYQLGNNDE